MTCDGDSAVQLEMAMIVTGEGTLLAGTRQGARPSFSPFLCSQLSRGPGQSPGAFHKREARP
jgi:hypothetical protein